MTAVRTVAGLVRACHPEATTAVAACAAVLAVVAGRGTAGVAATGATVLASQVCIGWSNDWLDAGRDAQAGRTDKPIVRGQVSRRTVGVAAVLAAPLTLALAALSGVPAALVGGLALAGGLLYNRPLKATVLSPLPYLVSFGALPAFVVLGLPGSPVPPWWLVAAGALLGGGAHFANVLPDLADDTRTGVVGLPHRLGRTGSWLAAGALLLGATAALAFGPPGPPTWAGIGAFAAAGVLLPAGGYLSRRPGSRALFRAVLLVALIDVGLLLSAGTALR